MKTPKRKPKPGIAKTEERVRKAVGILGDALDDYEAKHPHWRSEVLVSLVHWSLRSLRHYIEDRREKEISWENPFVELPYAVEWNWEASRTRGDDYGGFLYGNITDTNVADQGTAVATLTGIMARLMTAHTLGDLTNWVRFAKRGDYHTPCLPLELAAALNSIRPEGKRREAFEEVTRPFSIGAALVDYGTEELREGERVSKKVAAQLAKLSDLIDIPPLRLSGEVNGRKVEMSLIFQIHPLITDHLEERAYHPITIGLHFMPDVSGHEVVFENPAKWPTKDRAAFWEGLFQALDKLFRQLLPKEESEDSVILTVNAQLKIPASHWKPESTGGTMKMIAEALAQAGEVGHIQVQKKGWAQQQERKRCAVCGFTHDHAFTQILGASQEPITLAGVLPDIVRCVHGAHEKGFSRLSTKDEGLLRTCGKYGHPSKAFYDRGQSAAYKVLFDTSRRGFMALRGFRT